MNWGEMSRAARDAAYNNVAAVPDSAQYNKERNEASAMFRAARHGKLDLAYGAPERCKWDLYPAADSAAPCLVFIHGGYWQMNGREGFACVAEGVTAHGWSVAMPSHTLGPDASMTRMVTEISSALDWLARFGAEHGIAGRVILSGWSAGAQLAALTLHHPSVHAALAISGIYELGPLRDTYINEKLRLTDEEIVAFSPLRLPAVPKPMTIAYGSREVDALVQDARSLHALRAAAHVPGALLPIAGADHFTILDELRRADGILTRHVLSLAD